MRFRGTHAGGGARARRLAVTVTAAIAFAAGAGAPAARAADPAVTPYGQVAAVGGDDTAADFLLPGSTSGLTAGDFVDPVGMSVAADPSAPGGEDIYVLDLINPQAINPMVAGDDADNVAFEYRLQKIAITPSTTSGSDAGAERVLACTTFTLQSTAAQPDQRAVSLAVNGASHQVDVLINEMPDLQGISGGYSIAQQIDQWPTTLEGGAPGTCPSTATPTALVPSTTLVKKNDPGLINDINGDSIAFAGTGAGAQLALGGSQFLDSPLKAGFSRTQPTIELFDSTGTVVGKPWKGAEAAANPLARIGPIAGSGSAGGGRSTRARR